MREVNYVLIGGGLASIRAARQIRKRDPEGSILIASDEPELPYDRPPLSKQFLSGEQSADDIVLEQASKIDDLRIDLTTGNKVHHLDAAGRCVALANGERIRFERALIATGGTPVRLTVPGADLQGVHYLRTMADARAIASAASKGRRAVIIGGGFIGIELAATLLTLGLDVTVVESLPHIWGRFAGTEVSRFVERYCTDRDVRIVTSSAVSEIRGEDRANMVVTDEGDQFKCDLVCVGVGIRPNVELAIEAGLSVDNGILVDEYMRTSRPDIFAAGDVINWFDITAGRRRRVEHWGHAEYSGQIAGANMTGATEVHDLLSYVWSDIFDLHIEFAGDEDQRDCSILRGDPAEDSFFVFYLKNGRITAFFAVNREPREVAVLRRLIRTRTDVSTRASLLCDPASDLSTLL